MHFYTIFTETPRISIRHTFNKLLTPSFLFLIICLKFTASQDEFFVDTSKREYEDHLRDDDFANAKNPPDAFDRPPLFVDSGDGMYNADKFEGDIANPGATPRPCKRPCKGLGVPPGLSADTVQIFMGNDPFLEEGDADLLRNAVRSGYLLWPNKRVPYAISSQYTSYSRSQIAAAMQDYAQRTCIDFVPRSNSDRNYIYIMPDSGCYSLVGKTGGRQILSLGSGCVSKGIIIHELMHAVGFFHEQSRTDRDQYVTIQWQNIRRGMEGQFRSYSASKVQDLGTSYDYGSIMHYDSRAFSRNGQATIVPKQRASIGQRRGFSSNDVTKINRLYKCDGSVTTQRPTTRRPTTRRATTRRPATPPPPRPVTSRPTTGGSGDCRDKRNNCDYLVSTFDACRTQRRYMVVYCEKTCDLCGGTGGTGGPRPGRPAPPTTGGGSCSDFRSECAVFARVGLCSGSVFSGFMRKQCRRSCGQCGGGGGGGGGGRGGRGGRRRDDGDV